MFSITCTAIKSIVNLACRKLRSHPTSVVPARSALVLLTICLTACDFLNPEPHSFNGLSFDNPVLAPDFKLVDQNNQERRLTDFRGNIVLLFFGFTHCPDACPATLGTWQKVNDLLGENAGQVRFIMITVDPERDTPELMRKHPSIFNPAFIGLTGSVAQIEDIAQDYNVFFEKVDVGSAAGYLVNHSTLTYVIDSDGLLVLAHRSYETGADEIVDDIEYIIEHSSVSRSRNANLDENMWYASACCH